MPISFEQPQPLAPGVSAAYGETQQLSHDLPTIASIYQRNAAMQAQQAGQGQALQAQLIAQQGQQGERQLEMRQHGMDQAAQFATSRLPSERDVFAANAAMAEQNNRAANAAWLSQQQLSQQEQADLRKMQETVGYIQNAQNLTDDEKNDYITHLRTKIDPMRQRQERSQAEMMDQRKKQMVDQAAMIASMTHEDAAVRAKAFEQRTFDVENPITGVKEKWYVKADGNAEKLKFDPPVKEGASERDRAAEAQDKAKLRMQELSIKADERYHDLRMKAIQAVDHFVEKERSGSKDVPGRNVTSAERTAYFNQTIAELGVPGTVDEFRQQWLKAHGMGDAQRAVGGMGGNPNQPAPKTPEEMEADRQKAVQENPPMLGRPADKWTPQQQQGVTMFTDAIQKAAAVPMPEGERGEIKNLLLEANHLFHQYGSPQAMPDDDRKRFDYAMKLIVNLGARAKSHEMYTKEQDKTRGRQEAKDLLRRFLPDPTPTNVRQ